MRRAIVAPLLLLSFTAVAADQASDDRCFQALQGRLDDVAGRVSRLEDQSGSQGILNLLNQLETLESQVARLRGQLEELAHNQQLADKRQKDVLADFDARIKENHALATQAAVPAAVTPSPGVVSSTVVPSAVQPAGIDPEAENKAYLAALNLTQAGDYKAAVPAFDTFLKQYPNGSLAGNAMYWLGFSYFSMGDYRNAITTHQRLIKDFPQHAKVPDAMVNMARAHLQLGETDKANQILGQVVAKYPGTPSADTARKIQSLLK